MAINAATTEQVDEALQAQVFHGGRLGTNLVELGIIELEPLSTVLANLQQRPAALTKHFESPDRELQQSFAAHLAQRYACIPLFRVGASRVIVASITPLDDEALTAIAADFELPPGRVVATVAPELRIRYYLERVYDIPREARFLRVPGRVSRAIEKPQLHAVDTALDDARRSLDGLEIPSTPEISGAPPVAVMTHEIALAPSGLLPSEQRPTEKLGPREPIAPESASPPAAEGSRDRTRTSSRPLVTPKPSMPPVTEVVRQRAVSSSRPPEARISEVADEAIAAAQALLDAVSALPPVRNVETSERRTYLKALADEKPRERRPRESGALEPELGAKTFPSIESATRALRRCNDRDQLAELAIRAVITLCPSEAAIILSIRGDAAVGWTGISAQRSVLPEIVVPLDRPGLIATAVLRRGLARAETRTLGKVDAGLFDLLGGPHGELVAIPVTVENEVICVIASLTARNAEVTGLEAIAAACCTAFLRLLRNSNR